MSYWPHFGSLFLVLLKYEFRYLILLLLYNVNKPLIIEYLTFLAIKSATITMPLQVIVTKWALQSITGGLAKFGHLFSGLW